MFNKFLQSLKRPGNVNLIESIQLGYHAIFEHDDRLTFTIGNDKLGNSIQIFSLPAGTTCPFADKCFSKVKDGKIHDPKEYHSITNLIIHDDKTTEDDTIKIHGGAMGKLKNFKPNTDVGITDTPVKRLNDISNVEEKTITNIENNKITFDSDVEKDLPAAMNNKKALDTDNPNFRCFAASEEANYKNTRHMRMRNYDLILQTLKQSGSKGAAELINDSIRKDVKKVRIHESGDFFGPKYLEAWIQVAKDNSDMMFYAYTKSIDMYLKYKNKIPKNLTITGSMGGYSDKKIIKHKIPHSKVFTNYQKAIDAGYPIDFNDEIAQTSPKERIKKFGTPNFGLIIHATQSPGTIGSKESAPNSSFLHGMKAHNEGFGKTFEDLTAFNDKHDYATYEKTRDRLAVYGRLYDDWKAGWEQYGKQNNIKRIKRRSTSKNNFKKISNKKRNELENEFHINPRS